MKFDFSKHSRHELKAAAFLYHYGAFRDADVAKASYSGQAAAEMARRGGYEMPEPFLLKDLSIERDRRDK